jgi:hypothetical protein
MARRLARCPGHSSPQSLRLHEQFAHPCTCVSCRLRIPQPYRHSTAAVKIHPGNSCPTAAGNHLSPPTVTVDDLKKRLDDDEQASAKAALEKDYLERTQKEYESYYEKVLATQTHFLWGLGIIITVVLTVAARFSFRIFQAQVDTSLDKTSAQLRTEYTNQLTQELKQLKHSNEAQVRRLESDIKHRTDFVMSASEGLTFAAHGQYHTALGCFRTALQKYKRHKNILPEAKPVSILDNIFVTVRRQDPANFVGNAEKELKEPLYDDLENELAHLALDQPEIATLIKGRNEKPSPSK